MKDRAMVTLIARVYHFPLVISLSPEQFNLYSSSGPGFDFPGDRSACVHTITKYLSLRPASYSGLTLLSAPGVPRVSFPLTPLNAGETHARAGLRVIPSAETGRCSTLAPAPLAMRPRRNRRFVDRGWGERRARGPCVGIASVGAPPNLHISPLQANNNRQTLRVDGTYVRRSLCPLSRAIRLKIGRLWMIMEGNVRF
jgi:hypothetical protein